MSRQEDFKQASQSLEIQVISNPWTLFEKGCEHGYQYAVDKACEWIEKNMFEKCEFDEYGNITQTYACSDDCEFVFQFVEQIRKAMEEMTMSNEKRLQQIRDAARYKYPDERIHFIDGAKWADQHPHWIPVEEELPKEKGKYMFRLSNGDMCYETYYPKLKLVANVTHWMPIVPPRKEE